LLEVHLLRWGSSVWRRSTGFV